VVHDVRELFDLSLAHLKLLVPLLQLCLEVLDIPLGTSQLIIGVLQLGAGAVERLCLEVEAALHPQQVIVQLLVVPLKRVGLLE
jgi:hypothetical protein